MIRPVSALRNNFAEISKIVHKTAKPVFLTKNGYGDMVVLSKDKAHLQHICCEWAYKFHRVNYNRCNLKSTYSRRLLQQEFPQSQLHMYLKE